MVLCFFEAAPSFEWLAAPLMADEPPPGDAIFRSCSWVSTFLMFGERAISSSESPAPAGSGVPETVCSFRTLWIGEGSLPMCYSGFLPHETEVVRESLVDAAREGGGAYRSSILQSGTYVGES